MPLPDELHIPPPAIVTEPLNATVALLAQMVWLLPALAVGPGVIVIVMALDTGLQPPLLADVKVSVTSPAEISPALGT